MQENALRSKDCYSHLVAALVLSDFHLKSLFFRDPYPVVTGRGSVFALPV